MVQDFREGLVTNPNMIISQLADGAKLCEWDGDGFFLKAHKPRECSLNQTPIKS